MPFPGRGRRYLHTRLVGPADVTPAGNAHLDAIARWLQDAAHADIADVEMAVPGAWLVRRMRVSVRRFPSFGERLEIATFCSGLGATVAERRTSVGGDAGADVETVATWVHVDPERMRPARFPEEMFAVYEPSAGGRRARSGLRHPPPPPDASESRWRFTAADVDLADHVNHTVHWRIAEEELAGRAGRAPLDVEAEYRAPAPAGEASVLSAEDRLWIAEPAGGPYASFRFLDASP